MYGPSKWLPPPVNVEIHLKPEQLKVFEGKYTFQFEKGKDSYIEITAHNDHITSSKCGMAKK
jgi:hypothetical protein